jgi:chromosome segregation ATPase
MQKKERDELENKRKEINAKLEEKKNELEKAIQQRDQIQEEVTRLENELEKLHENLASLVEQCDRCAEQLQNELQKQELIEQELKTEEDKLNQMKELYQQQEQQVRKNEADVREAELIEAAARRAKEQAQAELVAEEAKLFLVQAQLTAAQTELIAVQLAATLDPVTGLSFAEKSEQSRLKVIACQEKFAACQKRITECKTSCNSKVNQYMSAHAHAETMRNTLEKSRTLLKEQESQLKTQQQQINAKTTALNQQKIVITETKNKLDNLRENCEQIRNKIKEKTLLVNSEKIRLEQQTKICATLEMEVSQIDEILNDLIQHIQRLDHQIEQSQYTLKEKEAQINEKQCQLSQHKSQSAIISQELNTCKTEVSKRAEIVQNKQIEVMRIDDHLKNVQANLDTLNKSVPELENILADQKQQLQNAHKEMHELKKEGSKLASSFNQLAHKKEQVEQQITNTISTIESQRANLNEKRFSKDTLQRRTNWMKLELKEKYMDRRVYQTKLNDIEDEQSKNKTTIDILNKQINDTKVLIPPQKVLHQFAECSFNQVGEPIRRTRYDLDRLTTQMIKKQHHYCGKKNARSDLTHQVNQEKILQSAANKELSDLSRTLPSHRAKIARKQYSICEVNQSIAERQTLTNENNQLLQRLEQHATNPEKHLMLQKHS